MVWSRRLWAGLTTLCLVQSLDQMGSQMVFAQGLRFFNVDDQLTSHRRQTIIPANLGLPAGQHQTHYSPTIVVIGHRIALGTDPF